MYQPRDYRSWVRARDLISFNVAVRETDLRISAQSNLRSKAQKMVLKYREKLERYIQEVPSFLTSLAPLAVSEQAPDIVCLMAESADKVGVGPMAAVAGAIAQLVGNELLPYSPEVIVENGGDIYLRSLKKRWVGIYAGSSPLTGQIGLEIKGEDTPLGISTSSGTVGHSLSFGKTDAVTVVARSAALADAAATAIGNMVSHPEDIPTGIAFARTISEIQGGIIIIGDKMGIWGKINITHTAVGPGSTAKPLPGV